MLAGHWPSRFANITVALVRSPTMRHKSKQQVENANVSKQTHPKQLLGDCSDVANVLTRSFTSQTSVAATGAYCISSVVCYSKCPVTSAYSPSPTRQCTKRINA